MNGPPPLSAGALAQALAVEQFQGPIFVQVLEVQHITPKDGSGPKRAKVTVNDGMYKCTALLATQLKDLVDNGTIQRGTVLRVNELVGNKKLGNNAANKKLLIFLNLDVVGTWPDIIGNPVPPPDNPADSAQSGAAPAAAAAAAAGPGPGGFGAAPAGMQNGPPPGSVAAPGMYGQAPAVGNFGGPPPQQQQQQPAGAPGMYGQPPQQPGGPGPFGGGGLSSNPGGPNMYRPPGAAGPAAAGGGGGGGMYGGAPAGPQYGGSHGPTTQAGAVDRIVPVRALNPYQNRWTIKARVTQKGDVRRWSNPRNDGKLMSFDLVDKDGGEIRATAWNDQVDQFQDLVQVGQVLLISKAQLKPRNAKFNNTPHDFEIYLDRGSQVVPCPEDPEARLIPHIMFNFHKLAELEQTEPGKILDVIGVVERVDSWGIINKKDGTETRKRAIVLRDDSGRSVEVTLWDKFVSDPGDQLENMVKDAQHPVLAIKSARVGDFNGRSLSTLSSSTVVVNPDRPETNQLHTWFTQGGGATMPVTQLSGTAGGGGGRQDRRVTLSQIEDEGLGMQGQAEWVHVVGTIYNINAERAPAYPACTLEFNGRACQKKLTGSDGAWFCERCNASVEQPAYRYLLSLQVCDHTGAQELTAFGEAGELIMGCPAEQVARTDQMEADVYQAIVQRRLCLPYNFKLKVFMDNYNDEQRRKVSVSKVWELDYCAESRQLLDFINKLDAGQPIFTAPQQAGTQNAANRPMGGPGAGGMPAPNAMVAGGNMGGPGGQQFGGTSPYGGGGGGGWNAGGNNMGGGPPGRFGGPPPAAGGYGGGPGGAGGGWGNGPTGGYQQQPPQQPYNAQQQPGGNWGGGGPGVALGGGGGMYGGQGGGGGPGPNQGPGGFQQQQQQQGGPYNQQQFNNQPFAAGFA